MWKGFVQLVQAGAKVGPIMACGDVVNQFAIEKKEFKFWALEAQLSSLLLDNSVQDHVDSGVGLPYMYSLIVDSLCLLFVYSPGLRMHAMKREKGASLKIGDQTLCFDRDYELSRTIRLGIAGFIFGGPIYSWGMLRCHAFFAKETAAAVTIGSRLVVSMKKVCCNNSTYFCPNINLCFPQAALFHFTVFPVQVTGMLATVAIQEFGGKHLDSAWTKMCQNLKPAYMGGCACWPLGNTLNWTFVPPQYQVPVAACVGVCYNTFFSYINAPDRDKRQEEV